MRLFVHREQYGRFVSCLVFVPRDRYTTPVRVRIADVLIDAFGASSYEWNTRLSASVLARLHYVLRVDPTASLERPVDVAERRAARRRRGPGVGRRPPRRARRTRTAKKTGLDLLRDLERRRSRRRTRKTSPPPTRSPTSPSSIALDADDAPPLAVRLDGGADHLDLKLYGLGAQPSLSEVLPRLTNMGVIVDDEHPYDDHARPGLPTALDQALPAARAGRTTPTRPRTTSSRRRSSRCRRATPKTTCSTSSCSLAGLVVARGRAAARVQPLPAPGRHAVQPDLHRARTLAAHPDIARAARRAVRDAPRSASADAAPERDGDATERRSSTRSPPRSTRSPASTKTASCARCCTSCSRRCARTGSRPTPTAGRRAVRRAEARPGAGARPPAAPPDVRDLRVLAARRRRAPARGPGRARRHPLVGPARRLPHRSARADEGAEGEERGDRAVGREGRLRREAAARRSRRSCAPRSRRATACSSPALLDVTDNLVTAPTVVGGRAARRRSCATTATIPTSSSRPTRAPPRSPTSPTRSRCSRGFWLGDAFASGGSARLRPQGDGHHRPRRVGVGAPPLPPPATSIPTATTSPWSASATCRATCSATACCCRTTSGSSPRSTTGTCSSIRIPTPSRRGRSASRLFELPRSSWADYDTALHLARAAASTRASPKSIPITDRGARPARHRRRRSPRARRPS